MHSPIRSTVRAWRDGSVHIEIAYVAFFEENTPDSPLLRHLDGALRSETLCELPYWGKCSSSGYGEAHTITCPDCRTILENATLTLERGN